MAKKLAITIAGAVSLGSYEAGVMFEVLDTIAQHNQWATQNSLPDERIEIDVLTGASAGGMTVAMVAQRLLFDGAAMALPYDNALYNAWVRDIDIAKLLARNATEPATHSLFSSDCVIAISKSYLTSRYATLPPPAAAPHLAMPADGVVQLGLALSNLSGVDYCRKTQSGGDFTYTDHQDQFLQPLNNASADRPDLWETIRSTAVACGAFPIAFRVQDLPRYKSEYPYTDLIDTWNGKPTRFFTYTDGGVFQNEPLGMAKNLVEKIPDGRVTAMDRAYLFVAPQPKSSEALPYTTDPNISPSTAFGTANATYLAVVERLVSSVIGQAAFQDWITAEEFNDKLRLLDRRADGLQTLYMSGTLTAAQTKPVSDAILNSFSQTGAFTDLDSARDQLRQQYATEFARFTDPAMAAAWLDSVLVLELAADLHCKEEMFIYDFVAGSGTLAGEGLHAFEGFFDVRYRKHDYDVGRTVAQTQLAKYKTAGGLFANLHWTPQPIDPVDDNLNTVDMTSVDPNKRNQVKSQVESAADALLQEMGVNELERKLVELGLIDGQIKKVLSL